MLELSRPRLVTHLVTRLPSRTTKRTGFNLEVEEDEVHLDEDEGGLEERPQGGRVVLARLVRLTEARLKEEADLDGRVDHGADAKHYRYDQIKRHIR